MNILCTRLLLATTLLCTLVHHSDSQAVVITPPPREGTNDEETTAPCGAANKPGEPRAIVYAGDTVNIRWYCGALSLGGTCSVRLSSGPQFPHDQEGMTLDDSPDVPQTAGTFILMDHFPCCGSQGTESVDVVIPPDLQESSAAVVQWIWHHNTQDGDKAGHINYFNCVDMTIHEIQSSECREHPFFSQGMTCNGHGNCRFHACDCFEGFSGDLCEKGDHPANYYNTNPTYHIGCHVFNTGCGDTNGHSHGDCSAEEDKCLCQEHYHGSRCEMYLPDQTSVAFHMIFAEQSPLFTDQVFDFERFKTEIGAMLHIHRERVQTHNYALSEQGHYDVPFEIIGAEYSKVAEVHSSFAAGQRLLQAQNAGVLKSWGVVDLESRFDPPNLALVVTLIVFLTLVGSICLGCVLKRCYDSKLAQAPEKQIIEVVDEEGNTLYKDTATSEISFDKPTDV